MTFNLVHALATALDDGCSLDELEATLLKGSDTDDRIAAAWLYAWAYDEIRPPHDDLAARITSRHSTPQTPTRPVASDRGTRPSHDPGHSHRACRETPAGKDVTRLRTASDGKESEVAAFTRSLQSESRARVGEPRGARQRFGRAFGEEEGKQSGPEPHIGAVEPLASAADPSKRDAR